jgi:hypothetical protein
MPKTAQEYIADIDALTTERDLDRAALVHEKVRAKKELKDEKKLRDKEAVRSISLSEAVDAAIYTMETTSLRESRKQSLVLLKAIKQQIEEGDI